MKAMKWKIILLGIVALSLMVFASSAMALSTTINTNATTLANALSSGGITVSGATYSGGSTAAGFFTGGASSGLVIDEGVILSSGSILDAPGPNSSNGITTDFGLAGYGPLTSDSGFSTYDAAVLAFDFTTTSSDLYFNFVFASDEYEEYVGSEFNDVFGLYVDGINVGVVPGTSTPITINTVNQNMNTAYYNANLFSPSTGTYDLEYDGFTVPITASISGLDTSTSHTMVFSIADASDYVLDSSVFIEAGTFGGVETDPGTGTLPNGDNGGDNGGVPVPEPSTLILLGTGLIGIASLRRRI